MGIWGGKHAGDYCALQGPSQCAADMVAASQVMSPLGMVPCSAGGQLFLACWLDTQGILVVPQPLPQGCVFQKRSAWNAGPLFSYPVEASFSVSPVSVVPPQHPIVVHMSSEECFQRWRSLPNLLFLRSGSERAQKVEAPN